jgi:hypothetical protein
MIIHLMDRSQDDDAIDRPVSILRVYLHSFVPDRQQTPRSSSKSPRKACQQPAKTSHPTQVSSFFFVNVIIVDMKFPADPTYLFMSSQCGSLVVHPLSMEMAVEIAEIHAQRRTDIEGELVRCHVTKRLTLAAP